MSKVFISYSSKDDAFARKLVEKLEQIGVQVWIDYLELKVGDSLTEKISTAIDQCDYLAVILSSSSVSSKWVNLELAQAMTNELGGKNLKVLPILIEDCEMPSFLKDKVYIDFREATDSQKFDQNVQKLARSLDITPKEQTKSESEKVKSAKLTNTVDLIDSRVHIESFEDLKLVGVDRDSIYKPNDKTALYNIPLRLSYVPPEPWVRIFEAERRFPRHSMWRRAWVDGRNIVVHCVPDEMQRFHLNDIKQDVNTTNRKYRDVLLRNAQQQLQSNENQRQAFEQLNKTLDELDFD